MTASGSANRKWKIFALFLAPGLIAGAAVVAWGIIDRATTHPIPQWKAVWLEPKFPPGEYLSFRQDGVTIVGETQPFPPNHPRSFSTITSFPEFSPSQSVSLQFEFLSEGDVEVQLLTSDDGATPFSLLIGAIPGGKTGYAVTTTGNSPLLIDKALELNKRYHVRLQRERSGVMIAIDDKPITQKIIALSTKANAPLKLRLRLHNVKIRIHELAMTPDVAKDR